MVTTRYLQSGLLGKAAATDVCQMFLFCAGKLDQAKFLQVMSDGPNVNLKFPKILNEERSESELKLKAMNKIFHESPSRRADYEKLTLASEQEYPLQFCSTRWIENERVAKRAQLVWPKVVEIVGFWKGLQKSKQPGQGKPGANKSYDTLLKYQNDVLVPLKLQFFQEVANHMNSFLITFQSDAPMVPLIVDKLENLVRFFCNKFVLPRCVRKSYFYY